MARAWGPERRTIATPPAPGATAVAMAAIVSVGLKGRQQGLGSQSPWRQVSHAGWQELMGRR